MVVTKLHDTYGDKIEVGKSEYTTQMHSQFIYYHVAERSTNNTPNFIILKSTLLHKSSVPIATQVAKGPYN